MKALILIASLFASSAFASPVIDEMTQEQSRELVFQIAVQIAKHYGEVQLMDIQVDWSKANCFDSKSTVSTEATLGLCRVPFSGSQTVGEVLEVVGEAAIIGTVDGREAKIIYSDVQ